MLKEFLSERVMKMMTKAKMEAMIWRGEE